MNEPQIQRGRKAIAVTPAELQEQIQTLEAMQPDGKFASRSALWQALSNTTWAKTRQPRPLSEQVAMIMAKNNNLVILTPVGRRGREKGCAPINTGGKRQRRLMPLHILTALKQDTPASLHKVCDKAAGGSLRAAVKLKCLDCSCGVMKEVALCTIKSCPLYHFRPYKRVNQDGTVPEAPVATVSEQTNPIN